MEWTCTAKKRNANISNKQMFDDGREDTQQYKDEYKKLMSLEECLPNVTDVESIEPSEDKIGNRLLL